MCIYKYPMALSQENPCRSSQLREYQSQSPRRFASKLCLHFSMCACHPCAGAMLMFHVSLQLSRMLPEGNPATICHT